LTQKDLKRGGASGPFSREQLDSRFGRNAWRPLKRFAIHQQHNDKWRAIDDGLWSGHNECTSSANRVHTTSHDAVLAIAKRFNAFQPLLLSKFAGAERSARLEGGTDDEEAAYRWKPVADEDEDVCISGFFHPVLRKPMYILMNGHPFGLASAVLNYNRGPALQVAVLRQLLRCTAVHYYDDLLCLGINHERGSSQASYRSMCQLGGVKLDSEKGASMSPSFIFTGAQFDLANVLADSATIELKAKPGRREALLADISSIQAANRLSPASASTLRGKAGFLGGQVFGRVLRGCEWPLIRRQYFEPGPSLGPSLNMALEFLKVVLARVPHRSVKCGPARPDVTVLYTDAMYEPGSPCGLGFVMKSPLREQPVAGVAILPEDILLQFLPRKQQIGQAECFAALLAPYNLPELFTEANVIHFVDNQSALSCLISGSIPQQDTSTIVSIFSLLLAAQKCRLWCEYVESEANVSDGVSREGFTDPLVAQLNCTVLDCKIPEIRNLHDAPLETLLQAFSPTPLQSQ
jgi:hypothetical protein